MRSYWARFAYTGDPGRGQDGTLPEWTPWGLRADEPKFMRFDSSRDGGLGMASDTVTERAVVAKVASDPSL